MSKYRKLVKGLPPRSNADGRPLLSDRYMRYVAVDCLCSRCGRRLARFEIGSLHEAFDSAQVNERLPNTAVVERTPIEEPDGSIRIRYKFLCPKCRHSPVVRADRIDAVLAEHFEQNAFDKIVTMRV